MKYYLIESLGNYIVYAVDTTSFSKYINDLWHTECQIYVDNFTIRNIDLTGQTFINVYEVLYHDGNTTTNKIFVAKLIDCI